MRVEDIIHDAFIKQKIQEHIEEIVDCNDVCKVTRFEYPEGSGKEWKLLCQYNNEDGKELAIILKRRK
jgi:hypothetical protein